MWEPNESKSANGANQEFSHSTPASGPQIVTTSTLLDNGSYSVSETLYNALLQVRQTAR